MPGRPWQDGRGTEPSRGICAVLTLPLGTKMHKTTGKVWEELFWHFYGIAPRSLSLGDSSHIADAAPRLLPCTKTL